MQSLGGAFVEDVDHVNRGAGTAFGPDGDVTFVVNGEVIAAPAVDVVGEGGMVEGPRVGGDAHGWGLYKMAEGICKGGLGGKMASCEWGGDS